jgi:hypothetical protein
MEDKKQMELFGSADESWREYWKGMPEFEQRDLTPLKQLTVSFETIKDMEEFAKLVGQTITLNTRSIWFPKADIGHLANKRYVDES